MRRKTPILQNASNITEYWALDLASFRYHTPLLPTLSFGMELIDALFQSQDCTPPQGYVPLYTAGMLVARVINVWKILNNCQYLISCHIIERSPPQPGAHRRNTEKSEEDKSTATAQVQNGNSNAMIKPSKPWTNDEQRTIIPKSSRIYRRIFRKYQFRWQCTTNQRVERSYIRCCCACGCR